jgi:PKD repeat protein
MAERHDGRTGRILRGIILVTMLCTASPALWPAGSITFTPPSPNVEETVTFTLSPPCSFMGSVQWTFGDGGTSTGGTTVSHKYLAAGTFNVVARVNCDGNWTNTSTKVAVKEERRISFNPAHPTPQETVTFHAENFLAAQIKWNFGDGTIKNYGSAVETHAFSGPGTFAVTATDFNGSSCCPVTTTVVVSQAAAPSISYMPAAPQAGETVTFTALNFSSTSCIRWNFGDGAVEQDTTPPQITHTFASPGNYTVRANDNCGPAETAWTTVFVGKAARFINYAPSDPRARENITFRAIGFLTDQIKWDFGDGTVLAQATAMAQHAYENPGLYTVQAWDSYGLPPATSVLVSVGPDLRMIAYTPAPAVTDKELTFSALNFRSSCIRWEFGDGTTVEQGSSLQTHSYRKEGSVTVTAYENCGKDLFPKSLSLRVLPSLGPTAPFGISFIQLRFEDGKAYREVPREFQALRAFADIKFEGTGSLQGDWLVDGQPFRPISETLSFARELTIDSGLRPPLPTNIPGPHEVSLRLTQPPATFQSPVIRYFVSSEAQMLKVALAISKVEDIDGHPVAFQADRLTLKTNQHYLLTGTATNVSATAIGPAVLSIYSGSKLIDQKRISRLGPGEPLTFETSMLMDTAQSVKMNIQVSELSAGGKMLGQKSVDIGFQAPGQPVLKPDLCIESLTTDQPFYRRSPAPHDGVITLVIKNCGGSDVTTPFKVIIEYCRDVIAFDTNTFTWPYDDSQIGAQCNTEMSVTVPSLGQGQSLTYQQDKTFGIYTDTGCYNKNPHGLRVLLRAKVDSHDDIPELNEQNNVQALALVVAASDDYDPALDKDQDGWMTPQDCNDLDPKVSPCGLDLPGNAIDEDCAGGDTNQTWIPEEPLDALLNRDFDGDGYPFSLDCDDYNSSIHPGAAEIPGDGRDNNCNHLIDEGPGLNWQIVRFNATRVGYQKEDIEAQIEQLTQQGETDPEKYKPVKIARVQGSVTIRFDPGSQAGQLTFTDDTAFQSMVLIIQGAGVVRRQFNVPASLLQSGGEQVFNYDFTYAELGFSSVSQGNAATIVMSARVDPNNLFPGETSETDNTMSETLIPGPSPITMRQKVTINHVLFSLSDGGYTHGGAQDEWEYGVRPPGMLPYPHESASHCWATDLDGYYENDCDQWLESPSIPIPADILSASIGIDCWANFASHDHGYAQIWQGGTKILEEQIFKRGISFTLPVSSFGHSIKVRFRVTSNSVVKKEGLYLFRVTVSGEAEKEI